MKKIYELEISRHNISPKQFFSYCKRQFEKKTGCSFDSWIEKYEDFTGENGHDYVSRMDHDDWDDPKQEICKTIPYDVQFFLERTYNFIMEFTFDDEKIGYGYMYAIEFQQEG